MKKILYSFIGGEYNGMILNRGEVGLIGNGRYSEDLSLLRKAGRLVHGPELDNQPLVDGYLGPMRDGLRYVVGDKFKYEFECTEDEKANNEAIIMLRYETQEVYNMLSR